MRGLIQTVVVLCAFGVAQADWLEFNAGCFTGSEPVIRHCETTQNHILFNIELRGLESQDLLHEHTVYKRLTGTPGIRLYSEPGFPEVPVVTCFVAVPDNVSLSLESFRSCADGAENVTVYPAPLMELISEYGITCFQETFQKNSAAYSSTEWFPSVGAEISSEFRLRDQRVAVINVYPVQFLASEDSLRVWSDVELYIEFSDSAPVISTADLGPYEGLIGDMLIGYEPDPQPFISSPPPGSVYRPTDLTVAPPVIPDYVIIVAGGLDGTWIDDFANYRSQLNGFDVLIATGDDIFWQFRTNERVLDPNLIRDFTETLWGFGSPGNRPSYLLLIGDHEDGSCTTIGPWFMPTFIESFDGYGNDEWYTYFDEQRDIAAAVPDMMVGRLSTRDTANLQDMLELIESYEAPVVGQGSISLQYRRYLTRLAGTDHQGTMTFDDWRPSAAWTEGLKDWLGYQWDNYYCGDGEDTWDVLPPNPDGSRMTSEDWVEACNTVFNRGSLVAFYTDHGDMHMFSAGLNWGDEQAPAPDHFGLPDSSFNDFSVQNLGSFQNHWHPFVLMLCCSAGTFNHTQYEHDNRLPWPCLCYEPTDGTSPPYDFNSSCLAEEFTRNTNGGAIGVFASSTSSLIPNYEEMGKGIIVALFEDGVTRMGDAIAAGRFSSMHTLYSGANFESDLGKFNLLGDPALDIGDRMKYRSSCDLVISSDDISMNAYPTRTAGSSSGAVLFGITIHNHGAVSSGSFDCDLTVDWNETSQTLTKVCTQGLSAGEQKTLYFEWSLPAGFEPGDMVTLSGIADPEEECQDSWFANNDATKSVSFIDTYPNDTNWPIQLVGSIKSPPILTDLDGNGDFEIIAIAGMYIQAVDPATGTSIWTQGPYPFQANETFSGFTVPASGDVCGDGLPEIIVDTKFELLVLDGSTGSVLYTLNHGQQQGNLSRGPHAVTLAEVFPESGKLEIAFVAPAQTGNPLSLFVISIENNSLNILDTEILPTGVASYSREWISAADINQDASSELILAYSWHVTGSGPHSGLWIYDHVDFTEQAGFTDSYTQLETQLTAGIQAVSDIAGDPDQIYWSRQHTASDGQTWRFDSDDLSTHQVCEQPINPSDYIHCCILADWDALVPGLDRILSPAENQCMAWNEDGQLVLGWNEPYESIDSKYPPFPALANLVSESGFQTSEVILGTRDGWVNAYDLNREEIDELSFPYQLPAEVAGGFVAADIDLDGKLELVFGTMDNYLHVWELGSCQVGYAPWPQTQHDAMRTGALEN